MASRRQHPLPFSSTQASPVEWIAIAVEYSKNGTRFLVMHPGMIDMPSASHGGGSSWAEGWWESAIEYKPCISVAADCSHLCRDMRSLMTVNGSLLRQTREQLPHCMHCETSPSPIIIISWGSHPWNLADGQARVHLPQLMQRCISLEISSSYTDIIINSMR